MADDPIQDALPEEEPVVEESEVAQTGEDIDNAPGVSFQENPQNLERTETRLEDVWGFFRMTTGTPTHVPKKLIESIAIDDSEPALYYYDYNNSQWRKAGLTIYRGRVGADGSNVELPSGWSSAIDTTGNYTVTHNLGSANYTVVLTGHTAAAARICVADSLNANDFSVLIEDDGGSAIDSPFGFILIPD